MSNTYHTASAAIHPDRHMVEIGGVQTRVRPKTFQLLLLFLAHPKQTLSKQYLLDTVWDDVSVDEQVLFQSVREIRQLFKDNDLIKTYPRKGYAWMADVHLQEKRKVRSKLHIWRLASLFVLSLSLFTALIYTYARPTSSGLEGPVLVLPVKNRIADNNHNWVPLGGMDHLIALLSVHQTIPVSGTESVLQAMRHAGLERDYLSADLTRLQAQTGAALVVESELAGYVEDYRLNYRLYFGPSIKRGTVLAATVEQALAELSKIVARQTGQAPAALATQIDSNFSHELMFRAFEQWDQGEHRAAANLLRSLVDLEPGNLVAHRLLGELWIHLGDTDVAAELLERALHYSQTLTVPNGAETGRLAYWLARASAEQGENEVALDLLHLADTASAEQDDWLYLAYNAQLLGRLKQKGGHHSEAEQAIRAAIRYHQRIRCPLGEAQARLQLAELSSTQGENALAERYLSQVRDLVERHQLGQLADFAALSNSL
ncbi:winged helix-turn-helix domain-containing protein [Marinimicrobium sp. ABcell2]|uniref:winged helix-turn-helix domain-containing protein n=1 Tax=Marinimicrobium sp. ABcell2 TaxID=3069751 RepID=UPI0027B674C4|nr:winged helix-turn-helix domain-containing protein [Marinimicrobium sp. ABcell2]MDQ2075910.1 winged helix-turn-helix domain-containing protein [Marinimicrobium sp. ABcell2]